MTIHWLLRAGQILLTMVKEIIGLQSLCQRVEHDLTKFKLFGHWEIRCCSTKIKLNQSTIHFIFLNLLEPDKSVLPELASKPQRFAKIQTLSTPSKTQCASFL